MGNKFFHLLISVSLTSLMISKIALATEFDSLPSIELHFENLPTIENIHHEYYKAPEKKLHSPSDSKNIPKANNQPKHKEFVPKQTINPEQKLEKQPIIEQTKIISPVKEKPIVKELPKKLQDNVIPAENNITKLPVVPAPVIKHEDKLPVMPTPVVKQEDKSPTEQNINKAPPQLPVVSEPTPANVKPVDNDLQVKIIPKPDAQKLVLPVLPKIEGPDPIKESDLPPLIMPNNIVKLEEPKILPAPDNNKDINLVPPPLLPILDAPIKPEDVLVRTDKIVSLDFADKDSNLSDKTKTLLDSAISNLKNSTSKIKIVAYSNQINNSSNDANIINLQRLINIKKYLIAKGIQDSVVSTSVDTKNNNQKNKNQIDLIKSN